MKTNRRNFLKAASVCVTGAGVSYAFSRSVTGRLIAGTEIGASDTLSEFDDQVVWLEANQFNDIGGWSNDSQHVDLMGSPYLLATGIGRPVADAVTTANIPVGGTYRLWVRCRDWLPSHSPGQFQVLVGGSPSSTAFGKSQNDEWQWFDGGEFTLQQGSIEVRLHDLTGWWGRCDAVVLAPPAFTPATELRDLEEQRIRYSGVTPGFKTESFDIIVAGAGPAGLGAALAAARLGRSVGLIQDRSVVGGNASSEIEVPPQGYIGTPPDKVNVAGIAEEIFGRLQGQTANPAMMLDPVLAEKNISLFRNTRATGVEMDGASRIRAIKALDVFSGQRLKFEAPLFIDCTGHGWIGYYARAEWRMGQEGRSEFNEVLAPEQPGVHTMGNTLYKALFKNHSQPIAFNCPEWAYQWHDHSEFVQGGHPRIKTIERPPNFDVPSRGEGRNPGNNINGATHHQWWVELGGMENIIQDAEKIRDELFRINIGLWNFAKNWNPNTVAANANRELDRLNYVPGVRESRRLVGDYIMNQDAWDSQSVYEDTIAFTDWGPDVHHSEGFWVKGNDCIHVYQGRRACIPYRTLYSKNIENLMMAGRCHSATQTALGGTRVMRPMCATGQAAGTAAVVALKHNTSPRGVYQSHIPELQQALLKDGCYLPGTKNTDSNDLALGATASASSTSTAAGTAAGNVNNGWNRVVGENRNAWAPLIDAPGPHWVQLQLPTAKDIDTIHVTFEEQTEACQVQIMDGGAWKTVATVTADNTRRKVFSISTVKTDRVRLLGDVIFRVCEMRLYREG